MKKSTFTELWFFIWIRLQRGSWCYSVFCLTSRFSKSFSNFCLATFLWMIAFHSKSNQSLLTKLLRKG
jgi:hypothetical protein